MNESIHVWRDTYDAYRHVGVLSAEEDRTHFAYDSDYDGPAISVRLPVQSSPFGERDTEIFFAALVPEGQTRIDFLDALRADRSEYSPLLERLNDESAGALVFSVGENVPGIDRSYAQLPADTFDRLARTPESTAVDIVGKTRLSLAGAMAKIGVYRDPKTSEWLLAQGSAPSTHIVKAGNNELFPYEILNEALCLELARLCDLPVEEFELIRTDEGPLLAVRRFDRPIPGSSICLQGHELPLRLHQEDLCQVGGTKLKYEPTGGDYLRFASSHVARFCRNGFGNAMMVLYYTAFSYLVGNCDNHLKNISLLYSSDMLSREVAPIYDVVDTTVYGKIKDTMGIALSPSRSIFDVTENSVRDAVVNAGFPEDIAMHEFLGLLEEGVSKFDQAVEHIVAQGFPEVEKLADVMRRGMQCRAAFCFTEEGRKTIDNPA